MVKKIAIGELLKTPMKKVFKWIGIVLSSLIGLLLVTAAVLYFMGNARLNKTYDFPPSNIIVPKDTASIEYGKHRAETLCEGCHGKDLSGINNWFSAGPLGTIDSANLTSGEGGIGREFTSDEDYVKAIRHGVNPDGKPIFMPVVVATAQLSEGRTVTVVGHSLNLESFIEILEETLAKARRVRPQGVELITFCKMLKDQSQAS